ncbi:alpha/beta hydrolase-fold protein [Frankia sp. QA3]|uniref:alpha/beta hydrolase-fold protein n=1 Tax=Frankia sp. QA3 TaxID=710111 RepID=UPI0006869618|nr:alpha/beta hydrolase-fold protein [Frankia sp. QA3]
MGTAPERAWRTTPRSPRAGAIEAASASPARFWSDVERSGAPFVDEVADDPDALDVTFVLRAGPASGPWTLADGVSPSASSAFTLTNVAGTDVWYVTLRLPRGTRVTYTFTTDVGLGAGRRSFDLASHFAARVVDPYNPRTISYPEQGILSPWGRTVSFLDLSPAARDGGADARVDRRDGQAAAGPVSVREVASAALRRAVPVYVYAPPRSTIDASTPLVVLFDGWEAVAIGSIVSVFEELVSSGAVPPFVAVMPDPREYRADDFNLSDAYVAFLTDELVGWARAELGVAARPSATVVGGASLGGLTALYAALRHPDVFTGAISVIGAVGAHRNGERDWLIRHYAQSPRLPVSLYVAAGLLDDDTFPGGLPAMLSANRRLRDVLAERGYDLTYREFPGGHDWVWLPEEFGRGIASLLGGPDRSVRPGSAADDGR